MAMRGLFLRENDETNGVKAILAEAPTDGDLVEIGARIYNFSTGVATGAFDVRFDIVMVNTREGIELPSTRETLATVRMESLEPLAMQEAATVWDTTGYSDTRDPDTNDYDPALAYRVYVVVDPGNEIDNEVHDWKDEARAGEAGWADSQGRLYHGNNEGYWPAGTGDGHLVVHNGIFVNAAGAQQYQDEGFDAFLGEESLSIEVQSALQASGEINIYQGQTYRLRAHLQASNTHGHYRHIFFYLKHPEAAEQVHAMVTVRGMREDTYIWTDWKPEETGRYEIWADFPEDYNDPIPGNARAKLEVVVLPEPEPEPEPCWPCCQGVVQAAGSTSPPSGSGPAADLAVFALAAVFLAAMGWRCRRSAAPLAQSFPL